MSHYCKEEETKKQVRMVSDMVNRGVDNKAFCEQFMQEHRYLQGEFFQLALEWIMTCGDDNYRYDDRNEFCHRIGKEIKKLVKEKF